ncbi:MAG: putative beta-lysine N-acetyltransferase [Methanobacteriota archaeon]
MESDIVIPIGKSLLQHGYFNDRIYLMKIHPDDINLVIRKITYLISVYNYSKVILKIPESLKTEFQSLEAFEEARIPGFYNKHDDALFLSRYTNPERRKNGPGKKVKTTILLSLEKSSPSSRNIQPTNIVIRRATHNDILQICSLFQREFETYPFPIQESYYLRKSMDEGIRFFVGEISGTIVAAGSCEIDPYAGAVEMSDLAIDVAYKGFGLSKLLLSFMEYEMKREGVNMAFTICRGEFLPVNRLFSGAGYQFGGTLIQNTNICGQFECMNVWYKKLG